MSTLAVVLPLMLKPVSPVWLLKVAPAILKPDGGVQAVPIIGSLAQNCTRIEPSIPGVAKVMPSLYVVVAPVWLLASFKDLC